MGNLASVAKALARSGADVRVTQSAAEVRRRRRGVVLPGVGAFRDAAARLEQSGLGAAVLERIAAGTPFLGVCLGLQLLFESSGEGGRWPGLGVLGGTVERLRDRPQGAAHRLERPGLGAGRRGHGPRAAGPGHRLLRALLRRASRRTRPSSPRRRTTARTSSRQWRATTSGRYSSIRRRVRASGSPCWRGSSPTSIGRLAPHDRVPRRRHPGRQGGAPASRRLRRRHRVQRRPGGAGALLAGRRAPRRCTSSTSTRHAPASWPTSRSWSASSRRWTSRSSTAAASAARRPWRSWPASACTGSSWAPPRSPRSICSTTPSTGSATVSSSASTAPTACAPRTAGSSARR